MLRLALALSLAVTLSKQSPISSIFSEQDLQCLANGTVFYHNNSKCYDILQQGPCGRNQWLVLGSQSGQVRSKCEECRCCRESSKKIFWSADGQCHRSSDKLCATGNKLTNDMDGTGVCVCKDGFARVGEGSECHPLYRRSTVCPQGQYLRPNSEGIGQCKVNPCKEDGMAPWTEEDKFTRDKSHCYQLNTQGPCPDVDQIYRVLSTELDVVGCFSPAFSITQVPTLCSRQLSGKCRPPITINTGSGGRPSISNKLQAFLKKTRIDVDYDAPPIEIQPTVASNNFGPSSNTWAWD